MEIVVTEAAQAWFADELELKKGDSIRIFGKYGGATSVHVGMSTGIQVAEPHDVYYKIEEQGITYFTEVTDDWFFLNYKLTIDLDKELNEPTYYYE